MSASDAHDEADKAYVTHHYDSSRWLRIALRPDDVLIGTYPKSGTTWMQQIVRELLEVPDGDKLFTISPWVDMRLEPIESVAARLEAQKHRRFLKHHLARHELPAATRGQGAQLYVARSGLDVIVSLYNFHRAFTPAVTDGINGSLPPGVEPLPAAADMPPLPDYFRAWLRGDGAPWWPFWEHIRGWWAARNEPHVLLVHYAALKRDPVNEVDRIYRFLAAHGEVREGDSKDVVRRAVQRSSFDAMRKDTSLVADMDKWLEGGHETFFNKGTNGRWVGVLPDDLVREYEEAARRELEEECAHWLATGERQ